MPAEEVAHRKEALYYEILPELQAVPEVLEQIDSEPRPHPVCGGLGQHARLGDEVAGGAGDLDKFDTLVCAGDIHGANPIRNRF